MNQAPAPAARQVHPGSTLPAEFVTAANDEVEGIEVTYLDVEEIALEAAGVPAWRPS